MICPKPHYTTFSSNVYDWRISFSNLYLNFEVRLVEVGSCVNKLCLVTADYLKVGEHAFVWVWSSVGFFVGAI